MMPYSLGEIFEKVLMLLGWGIYPARAGAQGAAVESALKHNTPERTDELYSNPKVLKRYLSPARFRYYDNVIRLLPLNSYHQRHIADAGCGTGHFLSHLKDTLGKAGSEAASLTGFDYSPAALELARRTVPEASFSLLDIYAPLAGSFDVLVCIEVLEHLLYPERALRNLVDMLAPDGVLILAVPNGRLDHFAGHINFWSPESWRVFLETTCPGFEIATGLLGNGRLAGEQHVNYALLNLRS